MRKLFVMAFMAMSMVMMAQHVTPLNIQIAEVKLDSLRTLYQTEPTMYRASLDVVAQQLARNNEEIKQAEAELKSEQAHAKEMENAIKEATKMSASLKKLYAKEESEIKSMQKIVEKQQRALTKQKALNEANKQNYSQLLEQQQKELGYELREIAERIRAISDLESVLQNSQTNLIAFMREIEDKATRLATLKAQYKERLAILKAEQKAAKSMQ